MYCPKCNIHLPEDSQFCQSCGVKLSMSISSDGISKTCNYEVDYEKKEENLALNVKMMEVRREKTLGNSNIGKIEKCSDKYSNTINLEKISLELEKGFRKGKYCNNCGGKVNPESKKCPDCGKQYFHMPQKTRVYSTLGIIIVLLLSFNIYQAMKTTYLSKRLFDKDSEISSLKLKLVGKDSVIISNKSSISVLQSSLEDKKAVAEFMDFYVVIVPDNGTRLYHKFGCADLDLSDFWVYNSEAAESEGYRPCQICIN